MLAKDPGALSVYIFRCTAFLLLLQAVSTASFAQARTSLVVRVVDSTQSTVPGAVVTIIREGSAKAISQTTDDQGQAVFDAIETGRYKIDVRSAGFASLTRYVDVATNATDPVIFVLSPGVVTTVSLTVPDEGDRVNQISALPNFNNDLTPLLQNTVGAVATTGSTLGRILLDGKGKESSTIRLDGVDATPQVDIPSADQSLDVGDSFQKPEVAFDLDNSPNKSRAFSPQFGPGTGTVVEGVSFAAADQWRAQLYAETRNSAFNARNYFDYFGKNGVQRHRFGGKTGGAIIGNGKWYLYFAYEGVRGRTERSIFEAVPFEAVCRCGVAGTLGTLLDGYLPEGTTILPGISQNPGFIVAERRGKEVVNADAADVRLDRQVSSSVALTIRYTPQYAKTSIPDGVTGRHQNQQLLFNNFLTSVVHARSPTTNTFRFGFNGTRIQVGSENHRSGPPELKESAINLAGDVPVGGLPGLVSVPVATLGSLVKGVGRGYHLDPTSTSFSYDFYTKSKNEKHELRFGIEPRLIGLGLDRFGGITSNFANLSAFRSGIPSTTSFLSDLSGASPFTNLVGRRHANQNYFLSYLQITSKYIGARLNLTYGLRYDYFGGVRERNDRVFLIDPETGIILPSGSSFFRTSPKNFQPRFGLSYTLGDENFFKDTVLRFGIGVYSGAPRIADLTLPIESDRLSTSIIGGNFQLTLQDILSDFKAQESTRQFQPLAFSRRFKIPERLYKWEASLTHTFKNIYDLIFLYTGNRGRQLPIARPANRIIEVSTNPDPAQPAIITREFDVIDNGQILKPYGEFFYRSSDGRSDYDAASVQFKRNNATTTSLPDWLNFAVLSIQYTYSKNRGNAAGVVASNPFLIDADYGFNSSDVRHSFKFSGVYNLWEAFSGTKRQSSLLWGWRIVGNVTARTGLPLIIRINRPDVVYLDAAGNVFSAPSAGRSAVLNVPGGGGSAGSQVPDILPNVDPYAHGDRLVLLNPLAFAIPQPGSFGNIRRGQLRGPGSVSVDLGVSRFLLDNEKFGSEFRIEAFNLFNKANFINPTVSLPNALGTSAQSNQVQPGAPFNEAAAGQFGVVSVADLGRRIQFSIVLRFKGGFTK